MATIDTVSVPLGDLAVGQTAVTFAVLLRRDEKSTKYGKPYYDCTFKAGHIAKIAKVWAENPCLKQVGACELGLAYRLYATGEANYGSDLKILQIDLAGPEHEEEGYSFGDLVPSSDRPAEGLWDDLRALVRENFTDSHLKLLVTRLLSENRELFGKMPAAKSFHHAYNSGLLEHVWSLTTVCAFLADHYASYYRGLNPPLNKDLILTAAIIHDIGKLHELNYDPFEVSYSIKGKLIGHVVMGRDMAREAASRIEGFPEETLMLLEHAILSHHGKMEFGAPVLPQTLEALIVSYADDLDAKINSAARARLDSKNPGPFTDSVRPLENRAIYQGIPVEPGSAESESA